MENVTLLQLVQSLCVLAFGFLQLYVGSRCVVLAQIGY
jgi:hypothetical protein